LILNLSGNLEFFRLSASPLRAGHIERERLLNELSHRVAALACRYVARTIQRHTDRIRKQWRCRRDDSYGSILDAPKSVDDEFGYYHSGNVSRKKRRREVELDSLSRIEARWAVNAVRAVNRLPIDQ